VTCAPASTCWWQHRIASSTTWTPSNVRLDQVEVLVFDPIDTLLQRGKHAEIERILEATPDGKQVVLVGRTLSGEALELARAELRDPLSVWRRRAASRP
jgi:superfamily II DNA/RNA helicase